MFRLLAVGFAAMPLGAVGWMHHHLAIITTTTLEFSGGRSAQAAHVTL